MTKRYSGKSFKDSSIKKITVLMLKMRSIVTCLLKKLTDPVKVIRTALQGATSISGLLAWKKGLSSIRNAWWYGNVIPLISNKN